MNPNLKKKRIKLSGKAWKALVRHVFERDNSSCCACGFYRKFNSLSCHHIKSKGSGGHDSASNLITLCRPCHNKVHSSSLPPIDKRRYQSSIHRIKAMEVK